MGDDVTCDARRRRTSKNKRSPPSISYPSPRRLAQPNGRECIMVCEEIDLTQSDDDSGDEAQQQPQPDTPLKCKSEFADAADAAAVDGNDGGGDAEGLQPATTGGRGLWSLWTRNFKSPLLMLLDLVDNAVDAAMPTQDGDGFTGRVQVYRDLYEVMAEQVYTTGLCIRNNSPNEIAPMKEVLQLFISAKANSGSDSIGENGVGLKQSCAALSDLSFVLAKNGSNKFELGIIAKALQKEDMVILPCFEFKDGYSIGQRMLEMFTKPQYEEVATCVAEYGRVRSGGNASLARGVARLTRHFDDMNLNYDSPHAFEVIIDKVVHRGKSEAADSDDKNAAVRDIINELQHEIPKRYLHIPERFKFCVGKKELSFKYWPERLVELGKVEIPVRSQIPWHDDFGEFTADSYYLRVFMGFDRYRIVSDANRRSCSLYIYSRASGRMIQYEPDARSTLGLNAGGTEFCQALTVIIDDYEGHLPLDPTKQGIAFGSQRHGHIHKENLFTIVNCVVKFFFNYHKNKYNGSKAVLSEKIMDFAKSELPDGVKSCAESEVTDYGVCFVVTKTRLLRVDSTCYKDEYVGADTLFRLLPDTKKVSKPSKRKPSKDKSSSARTSKPASAAKKKRASKAVKPPAKKKHAAKAKRSAKRSGKRQPTAEADNTRAKKKQSVAKTNQPLPKSRGARSSPRQPSKIVRYSDKALDTDDSDLESADDDEASGDGSESAGNVKVEMETAELDGGPIDLCSSSDEDDEAGAEVDRDDEEGTEVDPDAVEVGHVQADNALDSPLHEHGNEPNHAVEKGAASKEALKKENMKLKARVTVLETQNNELEQELENLRSELKKSKDTISVITRRVVHPDKD